MNKDWSQIWERLSEGMALNPGRELRHQWVLKNIQQGKTLDFGCGDGTLVAKLVYLGCDAYGFEPAEQGARLAQQKICGNEEEEKRIIQDYSQIQKVSKIFENIILSEVLEHVENPVDFLTNFVLPFADSNTKILITVPSGPISEFDRFIGHHRHYTRKILAGQVSLSQCTLIEYRNIGFPIVNIVRIWSLIRGKKLVTDLENHQAKKNYAFIVGALRPFKAMSSHYNKLGWQVVAIVKKGSEE